ncbi:hypothetical protein MRX96_052208 [Rhipicephalus microplus]
MKVEGKRLDEAKKEAVIARAHRYVVWERRAGWEIRVACVFLSRYRLRAPENCPELSLSSSSARVVPVAETAPSTVVLRYQPASPCYVLLRLIAASHRAEITPSAPKRDAGLVCITGAPDCTRSKRADSGGGTRYRVCCVNREIQHTGALIASAV